MDSFIFATNNLHKIEEIREAVGERFNILGFEEAVLDIDIPEPHDTLEANASEKSRVIHGLTGKNCFGEDTGLEVEALKGAPGVKSARYAGDSRSVKMNIQKLLQNMTGENNRRARFRTIISLIINEKEVQFEGICEGEITWEERGGQGFGYDPIFVPAGSKLSFGEMNIKEKNFYSHRKKAVDKLILFLQSIHT